MKELNAATATGSTSPASVRVSLATIRAASSSAARSSRLRSPRRLPGCASAEIPGVSVPSPDSRFSMAPSNQPQQWAPPPQQPYPPMPPMPGTSKKSITGGAHSVHLILTILTCGLPDLVWFLHWLFTRSKTTARY